MSSGEWGAEEEPVCPHSQGRLAACLRSSIWSTGSSLGISRPRKTLTSLCKYSWGHQDDACEERLREPGLKSWRREEGQVDYPGPDPSQMWVEKGWEVIDMSYRKGNSHRLKGGGSSQSGQKVEEGPGEVVLCLSCWYSQLGCTSHWNLTLKVALKLPAT